MVSEEQAFALLKDGTILIKLSGKFMHNRFTMWYKYTTKPLVNFQHLLGKTIDVCLNQICLQYKNMKMILWQIDRSKKREF